MIELRAEKAKGGSTFLGGGFVALDLVEGRGGNFAVAGGSSGNVVAVLAWLGWNSAAAGRVGADAAGDLVLAEFCEGGVNITHLMQDRGIATPIVIQRFVDGSQGVRSHRFLLNCPDCGAWLPRFRAMTLKQAESVMGGVPDPKVFYFDRVAPSTLKLASWARERGALVVFEPSSIGDERGFQRAVERCHILKYSNDRLRDVGDLGSKETPGVIVETLGEEGLRVRWRSRWSTLPGFAAPHFTDAAGAGDWCTAGLIHKIGQTGAVSLSRLGKDELDDALRFGQGLAAVNCAFEGARGAMRWLSLKGMNEALVDVGSESTGWASLGSELVGHDAAPYGAHLASRTTSGLRYPKAVAGRVVPEALGQQHVFWPPCNHQVRLGAVPSA